MSRYDEALKIIVDRFSKDSLISLATVDGAHPYVRTVNSYYEDGAFYIITYALSNKMRQIAANSDVAICGEWFTAHGIGENMGHVHDEKNVIIMVALRKAFAEWYDNGHTDENDPNTCLLRIRLTNGILLNNGTKYDLDFVNRKS